jgi:MEMO1 family protein
VSSDPLPRIRLNLDFMPSPIADRPGLLIRDPFRYSDVTAIIPAPLVPCLRFFDGTKTFSDLRKMLQNLTGLEEVDELVHHLVDTLSQAAFLENDVYRVIKTGRHQEFAGAEQRPAVHAGSSYPEDAVAVRAMLDRYLADPGKPETASHGGSPTTAIGIAAPQVSPEGGWRSYAAAYATLTPDLRDRTFVILGTSHYGEPDRFGLTRKPFVTPLGQTTVDDRLVDELSAGARDAVLMEDYCHAIEHSIEFQVIFLQHLYGPGVRILPILCGSFGRSFLAGRPPEDEPGVGRFLETLGGIHAKSGSGLFYVLGIDMAHMGRRYGDDLMARADHDAMIDVAARDSARLAQIAAGNANGFRELVQPNGDDLKWCGSAPVYTFLKAIPEARGTLLRYEQWNIDEASVVSFAGMSFRGSGPALPEL